MQFGVEIKSRLKTYKTTKIITKLFFVGIKVSYNTPAVNLKLRKKAEI